MLLELINISKYYLNPGQHTLQYVLKDLSLEVKIGESIAIIGPSGSGKSTLLNLIGALDRPNSGNVIIDGDDITKLDDEKLAELRNRKIGFVFQLHHLLPQCSVIENVLIPTLAKNNQPLKNELMAYAMDLLRRVGLNEKISYRPGQLSGGERQRVAVVRALINHPILLLADEPTGSLDRENAENLVELLTELNKKDGVTVIMVTHSHELAKKMSRILQLQNGKLFEKGA
ncbi:MAG: ABC transporter ATP-binding protein [bacterium]